MSELDDAELEQQGTQAHATRNWVFLHGTAEQFAQHTHRMLALEQEYLRRHPQRTWQGVQPVAAADPARALLTAVSEAGGRMHKLAVHQAARAAGLDRAALARLYARTLLRTESADRVLTDVGRNWLRDPDAPADTSGLRWVLLEQPTWDGDVARIIGAAPDGVFEIEHSNTATLPGDWWSACRPDGRVVGYGWMDVGWGEAEVLLAVDPDVQGRGVGGWILERLEAEAAARGLNYVYNTVRVEHPQHDAVREWLESRGYSSTGAEPALRKRVGRPGGSAAELAGRSGDRPTVDPARGGTGTPAEAGAGAGAREVGTDTTVVDEAVVDGAVVDETVVDKPVVDEAQGGYVDVAEHQY